MSIDINVAEKSQWKDKMQDRAFSQHCELMKTTVLAESSSLYFIFLPGSLRYSDVYRHESGRCLTFFFFLTSL